MTSKKPDGCKYDRVDLYKGADIDCYCMHGKRVAVAVFDKDKNCPLKEK